MSIEPKCNYCNEYTKFRCKNESEAAFCRIENMTFDKMYYWIQKDQDCDNKKVQDINLDNVKISVYMDFGSIYTYYVHPDKAREHASVIIETGYKHTPEGSDDLEWFPPHRILKVKVENGGKTTSYKDNIKET